jgi:chaperonin cofactor prefoldin
MDISSSDTKTTTTTTPSFNKIDFSTFKTVHYPTSRDPYFGRFSLKELRDELWFELERVNKKLDRYRRAQGSDVQFRFEETQRYQKCVQICFTAARSRDVSGAYYFAAEDLIQTIQRLITSCNQPGLLTHRQYIDKVFTIWRHLESLLNNKILIYALTEYGLAKLRDTAPNIKGSKLIICAAMMMDPDIQPPRLRQDIFSYESKSEKLHSEFNKLHSNLDYVTQQSNFIAKTVQTFQQIADDIWQYLMAKPQQSVVDSTTDIDTIY